MKSLTLLLAFTASLALTGCAPGGGKVISTIKAEDGKYDYISYDPAAHLAYIGRETGVMAFDPATGKTAWMLKRDNVAAPLLLEGQEMLSTNGGSDSVTLFDRMTGKVRSDITVGKSPDGAIYDDQSRRAYVMNGDDRTISVIDIAGASVIATWPVDGTPEGSALDGHGHLFVNLEDRNAIARIDLATGRIEAHYALQGCEEPTGLVLDAGSGLLVAACHNRTAQLVDAASGADRGQLTIGAGADGSLFDAKLRMGFIPCIDGTLTVYHMDISGKISGIETIRTADGARTAAFDPDSGQVFLPAAEVERTASGDYITARKNFRILIVKMN